MSGPEGSSTKGPLSCVEGSLNGANCCGNAWKKLSKVGARHKKYNNDEKKAGTKPCFFFSSWNDKIAYNGLAAGTSFKQDRSSINPGGYE